MRSRNSLMRERREAFRDARLIVIASEGKDTERIYFKALAKEYTNPRVHVHILERSEAEQNNSSPEHVLKQQNDYKEQYALTFVGDYRNCSKCKMLSMCWKLVYIIIFS